MPEPVGLDEDGAADAGALHPGRPLSGRSTLGEPVSAPPIPPSDHAIFFIHGVGGSSTTWRHQIRHFSRLGSLRSCDLSPLQRVQ